MSQKNQKSQAKGTTPKPVAGRKAPAKKALPQKAVILALVDFINAAGPWPDEAADELARLNALVKEIS